MVPQKPKKELSWQAVGIICIFALVTGAWPLALGVVIYKLVNTNEKKTAQEVKQQYQSTFTGTKQEQKPEREQKKESTEEVKQSKLAGVKDFAKMATATKAVSILCKVFGCILAFLSVLILVEGIGDMAIKTILQGGLLSAVGIGTFLSGIGLNKKKDRMMRYLAIIGSHKAISVQEISSATGISKKQVEKDIHQMLSKQYFEEGAYLDVGRGMLFLNAEAASNYRNVEREKSGMQETRATKEVPKETEQGYSGYLRQIRRANDDIADPVLSQKIDRLEELAGKIFQIVEAKPEREKEIRTFLDYYLPTTQKLLDSYGKFESAGVEGENLKEAKAKISDTMDAIVEGFEHQLDQLYQTDALDVDAEIRVMESMLQRDTASAQKDFFSSGVAVQRAPEEE